MIVLTQTENLMENCFANLVINNEAGSIGIKLVKETWVKDSVTGEWAEIKDARISPWRDISLDNSILIDTRTGKIAIAIANENGEMIMPETAVGAYNYICGFALGQLGDETTLLYQAIATLIESFIQENDLI